MRRLYTILIPIAAVAFIAGLFFASLPHLAYAGSDQVGKEGIDRPSLCAIGRRPKCSIKVAVHRGMFETGLRPQFAADARCRDIDEHWAIDYTYKRDRENYHGGIDIPAPFGTPIHAVASGTVVAIYDNPNGFRGIEIYLRHTPEDTGIPLYIYTDYAHLEKRPTLAVGDHVAMGDVVGLTGNSGRTPGRRAHRGRRQAGRGGRGEGRRGRRADGGGFGRGGGRRGGGRMGRGGGGRGHGGDGHGHRRPAVHFAVFFSASPKFAVLRKTVVPTDAYWMDPDALFFGKPPLDSASMKALPASEKHVPIPYMLPDHTMHPAGTKLVWPYSCTRRDL